MAISLSKGTPLSLSKDDKPLNLLDIALSWRARKTEGAAYDLDVTVFMLDENGVVRDAEKEVIFYGSKKSFDESVEHLGDNKTGGEEVVKVETSKISAHVRELIFAVTIHDGEKLGQTFGQVDGSRIKITNRENGEELGHFDITDGVSDCTAVVFGKIYRSGNGFNFKGVGEGFKGGLAALCAAYGVATK